MTPVSTVTGTATVVTDRIYFNSKGDADMINLTADVRRIVSESGLKAGAVTVFFPGATGAITTLEFEPGVVQDFANMFDRIISPEWHYEHNVTHPDHNGHAHVRAGLLGPVARLPHRERRDVPRPLAGDLLRLLRQPSPRTYGRGADPRRSLRIIVF